MKSKWEEDDEEVEDKEERKPSKKSKKEQAIISQEPEQEEKEKDIEISLYANSPGIFGCRSVDSFKKLNRIDEGTYGIVYRAQDIETGEIVALKKLKLERERDGFPITSLREIHTLSLAKHKNVVNLREIVVGSTMDRQVKHKP